MTLLYYSDRFLEHETGQHPECPARLLAIRDRLIERNWCGAVRIDSWDSLDRDQLATLHDLGYIDDLIEFARRGGGHADADTFISPASVDVARHAAGATVDAARRVLAGEDHSALCLVRPPGHHALANRAMGFCLFGNVALAAKWAVSEGGLDRVMVVDWDVHHGNGTQDLFYDDSQVSFLSMHRSPFWPGSGASSETGTGAGLGATRNLPVEYGTPRDRIVSWFGRELEEFAAEQRPQMVFVSAGFDAHRTDPVGGLGLEVEDFATLSDIVLNMAAAHAGNRVVSVLEGGYDPEVLAECVETHLKCLATRAAELS